VGLDHVRVRCERLLQETDVPTPFTMDEFCRRLGERRGRPITLLPFEAAGRVAVSGAWVELSDRDVILHDATTTPYHQQLIVAHEIGHMICDHYPSSVLADDVARAVLPSLDPALVSRILSRTDYTCREEQEAEVFATLLLRHVERQPQESVATLGTTALLNRVGSTFEE
jgi:hypothetical protein